MQEENGEGKSGSCFRCRHGGSGAGIGSGASKRSCSYGRAQISTLLESFWIIICYYFFGGTGN